MSAKSIIIRVADILLVPVTYLMAYFFRFLRKRNFRELPNSKRILLKVGVFPIRDHYYEPLFNPVHLKYSLRKERNLPGIDFNIKEQLELLDKFKYNEELIRFPLMGSGNSEYAYDMGQFLSGDSEYLYNIIRYFKPAKFIEIGSGHSTLMAINAFRQNMLEDDSYSFRHICIEPFENEWLDNRKEIEIIREMVENTDPAIYKSLRANDILFIDSSHMIRPQGDVLFEYLEILPQLNPGVIVHIHDIFSPRDYLTEWIVNDVRLWNEQYMLEAFLSNNKDFRIIGATNFLMHNYYQEFSAKCPVLKEQLEAGKKREPGSIWIIRN